VMGWIGRFDRFMPQARFRPVDYDRGERRALNRNITISRTDPFSY